MTSSGRSRSQVPLAADRIALERIPQPWRSRFESLGKFAADLGLTACLVGGCVRDLLLGRAPLDWDIVVEGQAETFVTRSAGRLAARVSKFPSFLTYTLTFGDGSSLDVATARRETYAKPAALPAVRLSALADDFQRRDFTVNAIAAHITPAAWGRIEDPLGGRRDLAARRLRALHARSFVDDPTRIYRAARYAGRYGLRLDAATASWLRASVQDGLPALLSPARRRTELERLLSEPDPSASMERLWTWKMWPFWSPRWRWRSSAREDWADTGRADPVFYRLLLLSADARPGDTRADLAALAFPRSAVDGICRVLEADALLAAGKRPAMPASSLTPEGRHYLERRRADALKRWLASEPLTRGEDLHSAGVPTGPDFQRLLEGLRQARWDGRVSTREDERRWIVDNHPRNK